MKAWGILLTAAVLGAAGLGRLESDSRRYTFHHENVLGTSMELKLLASSPEAADRAEAAALKEIDRQSAILSGYDPNSEFRRWTRTKGEPVAISSDFYTILGLYDEYRQLTHGALDASAETVSQVWKQAAAIGQVPDPLLLKAAVEQTQQPHWQLDGSAHRATHLSNASLMLNSFTKSYIIDRATDAALAAGATGAVLNIGGDLAIRGQWTEPVRIADPRADSETDRPLATVLLQDRAIATSGDYRRGFEIGGQHYSHIVDPRTGQPATQVISASVISHDPSEAGALATAFTVLTPSESQKLAATRNGVDYLLITRDGQRITSPGWPLLAMASPAPLAPAAEDAGGYELTVNLELARIDAQRYRRPYVAVWVEDKDKFPVKTIALWIEKTRWLPELTGWYHDDRLRAMAEGNDITGSVSSATRSPGKYTLKWDGKDDAGKLVKPGKYTIFVEAAREHGSHQIMRQELDWAGAAPKQIQIPGNPEIAAVTLDYHRTAH